MRAELKTAVGPYGYGRQLPKTPLPDPRLRLAHENVRPISSAFPRVVAQTPEFDVAELALVTYLIAKAHGRPITALPVFLLGGFPYRTMMVRRDAGIEVPEDLKGKRLAIGAISQTTGVWMRGILQDEYGVAFDEVTWVTTRKEHVPEFSAVGPIERRLGEKPDALLRAGEVDAIIGFGSPKEDELVRPLFPDSERLARRFFEQRGYFPINHTLVVRDELLQAQPSLATALVQWCAAGRRAYLDERRALEEDAVETRNQGELEIVGDRWLRCGLNENREALQALLKHVERQKILRQTPELGALFSGAS